MYHDEEELQKLIERLDIDDHPDAECRDRLREEMLNVFDRRRDGDGATRLHRPGGQKRKGRIMNRRIFQLATAALVVLAVGVGIFVVMQGDKSSIAFADVQQHVRAMETMICTLQMAMKDPAGKPMTMTMKLYAKEPGIMRQEFIESSIPNTKGVINIINFEKAKSLGLIPKEKMAIITDFGTFPKELLEEQQKSPLREFKKMIEGSNRSLGEKEIDGQKVKGFDVFEDGQRMEIWADAKTAEPVLVKMDIPEMNAKLTMKDFRFNEPLDDSLFSMDIPKDYKVKNLDLSLKNLTEKDLLAGLKMVADWNDGTFPEAMFSPAVFARRIQAIEKAMEKKQKEDKKPSDKEIAATGKKALRMFMFAVSQKQKGQFQYFGEGVKLGDSEKAIILYRPKDSKKTRIVFGDLHVKEVATDDVPADEKSE